MIKIKTITVDPTNVYDITVPDTSCFFANDILVHNCAEITLPTKPLDTLAGGSKKVLIKVPKDKVEEYKQWRAQWKNLIPPM